MNEEQWLTCTEPWPMLDFLRARASHRKLLLFACACCRRSGRLLDDEERRRAVETLERFADGEATLEQVRASEPPDFVDPDEDESPEEDAPAFAFHLAFCRVDSATPREVAQAIVYAHYAASAAAARDRHQEPAAQADLLRDLFGDPFRPPLALSSSLLAWHGGLIVTLAHAANDDRLLPSGHLDPRRLAVLCDALLDAGCPADSGLLPHLRGGGPHWRGCHALDALLGRP